MNDKPSLTDWLLFALLATIWGSSYILMKFGLQKLNAYQVASMRILSAGVVLLPFAVQKVRSVPKKDLKIVILAGLLGSFLPAYLFCIAETRIDSGLAAILNSLTPLCTIVIGVSFFQLKTTKNKVIGVIVGLTGLVLLPFAGKAGVSFKDSSYSLFVLIATLFYAINISLVGRYLHTIPALTIASVAFSFYIIPCLAVLYSTGFFHQFVFEKEYLFSVGAACVLGIMGTAIANILFYVLIKRAGVLFSSLITYASPFVALLWGLLAGESITMLEVGCLMIILGGVYLSKK